MMESEKEWKVITHSIPSNETDPDKYLCDLNSFSLTLVSPSPISVMNKTIDEDRFDIPDVPMEED